MGEMDGSMLHTARDMRMEQTSLSNWKHDRAPSPPEALLHALGACITATTNSYAAMLGVPLTHLNVAVEGDVDLHGKFGLGKNVRPGYQRIYVRISIDGDADDETLHNIAAAGYQYSIVRDTLAGGVEMVPKIEMFG